MVRYLLLRLVEMIAVLLGVSVVVFALLRLSGDPVALLLPLEATQEQHDALRQQLGLDDSLLTQYLRFIGDAVRGDFGMSVRGRQPALDLVLDRLPATALLTVCALAFSLLVALPAGVLGAVKRRSWIDRTVMLFALSGQSTPVFWLGIMLVLVFSVWLGVLPTAGYQGWQSLVLPTVTLGLFSAARTARLVRSGMLDVLGEDYVRTARAKGLRERLVVLRHGFRNALIPVVTVVGLDFAALIGGAVVTETVFGWPGVGRLIVEAIQRRDYPVVQAAVFLLAAIYVLVNTTVDLVYRVVDPRVRLG